MCIFKHAHRYLVFIKHSYMLTDLLAVCCSKSQYMYEYIIQTEAPLSELKTFPNCKKKLEPSARLEFYVKVRFNKQDHNGSVLWQPVISCQNLLTTRPPWTRDVNS